MLEFLIVANCHFWCGS